jgi:hypothetical protein
LFDVDWAVWVYFWGWCVVVSSDGSGLGWPTVGDLEIRVVVLEPGEGVAVWFGA